MKYIWHLNFHSSLKESFKPSLSLPSQRRQVWYSSLRMSFHIGMAEDFNIVNLLRRSESESEFLHCKSFCLLIGWKVNSYMVNLLKGVWMVAVTPLPSTWSRTARNIGHLHVGSLINYFFGKEEKEAKWIKLLLCPPLQGHPKGVVEGASVDGKLLESHAVLAIRAAPCRFIENNRKISSIKIKEWHCWNWPISWFSVPCRPAFVLTFNLLWATLHLQFDDHNCNKQ